MKIWKLVFVTVLLGIILSSCQKEELERALALEEQNESYVTNEKNGINSLVNTSRDLLLVSNFYDDLLALQQATNFYDDFYQSYGYLDWTQTTEYIAENEGKLLVVPVHSASNSPTSALFLYFDGGAKKQKIKFYSREDLESTIDITSPENLSSSDVFAYLCFILNDLEKGVEKIGLVDINPEVAFRNGRGGEGGGEECEGGSYEEVCVYTATAEQSFGSAALINRYIDRYYGLLDVNFYNAYSWDELKANYDAIRNGLWASGLDDEFEEYYRDRERLFNEAGAGNTHNGALTGITTSLTRTCISIWVWCWQDPLDLEIDLNSGGGGGGGGSGPGDFEQPWKENYDRLRFCEGVNDLFDVDPSTNPDMVHPDFEFCSEWMTYLENCILPNENLVSNPYLGTTYRGLIDEWAEFQWRNSDLFRDMIRDGGGDCSGIPEEEPPSIDERCWDAFEIFEETYGITLTKFEELDIIEAYDLDMPCGDQAAFDEEVFSQLLPNELLEALDWLLEHQEIIGRIITFLDEPVGTERDRRILLLEILLAEPQESNLTADLLDQMFTFWENHYTDLNGMGVVYDLGQFYLRSQDESFEMTFEEFEEEYEDWLVDLEVDNDPFTPGKIFDIANPMKQALINTYSNNPVALQKIENWFICWVMGIGFQEAVLESLGRNNFELIDAAPDGMSRKPDGYHTASIQYAYFPFISVGRTHTITEVKGVFSGSMPFNFTYQNQLGQFNDYLGFLYDNQYEGQFPNHLQLIVPGGVSIDESIISSCTSHNVMISTAVIEGHPGNSDLVRVSPFNYRNHNDLQYHPDQNETLIMNGLDALNFFELGKSFYGGSDYVNIRDKLQEAADIFEATFLQGNSNEDCPED